MDISFISSLMGDLSKPDLSKEEYNRLVGQLKHGAREMLSSLIAHNSNGTSLSTSLDR